jgi:RNA polymerase sigma factor (sigma-70 family)
MTREDYGAAYQKGYEMTVRFLESRGSARDSAEEIAQAAWVRGWERIEQLRDVTMVFTWLNTIALNILRSDCRRPPFPQILFDVAIAPKANLAEIDLRKILRSVKLKDRVILHRFYVEGFKVWEIAKQQGCTETALRIRLLRVRRTIGEHFEHRIPIPSRRAALGAAGAQEASFGLADVSRTDPKLQCAACGPSRSKHPRAMSGNNSVAHLDT